MEFSLIFQRNVSFYSHVIIDEMESINKLDIFFYFPTLEEEKRNIIIIFQKFSIWINIHNWTCEFLKVLSKISIGKKNQLCRFVRTLNFCISWSYQNSLLWPHYGCTATFYVWNFIKMSYLLPSQFVPYWEEKKLCS